MNRLFPLVAAICCFSTSCDLSRPDEIFGKAVLNLNMFHGFAGRGMEGQLKQPSMKLAEGGSGKVVQMRRKEVVDDKILFAENSRAKVAKLKQTDETKAMIETSLAVYDFIIPVYKNEYQELARLHDEGAPQTEIDTLAASIREKYAEGYQTRMDAVVTAAKPYADKHGLKVNWNVGTTP